MTMLRHAAVVAVSIAALGAGLAAAFPNGGHGGKSAPGCGGERLAVRTLSDPGARRIDFSPRRASVTELARIRAGTGSYRGRVRGTETMTYRVEVNLLGMQIASGGDVQVDVSDPRTGAGSLKLRFPRCIPRRAAKSRAIAAARTALERSCGRATRVYSYLKGTATVTGVGYLGAGRRSRAALAPVLRFAESRCSRPVVAPAGPVAAAVAPAAAEHSSVRPPPPDPPCTRFLDAGSIDDAANAERRQVLCLRTAYFKEPGETLIVIRRSGVRVQPAPGEHPIVCGHFVIRGSGSSVSSSVTEDRSCTPLFHEDSPWNRPADRYGAALPLPDSWIADFNGNGGRNLSLERSWDQGKAIFQASPSDPVTATFRMADASQCFDDPSGCTAFNPKDPDNAVRPEGSPDADRIPIPAGVRCAGLPVVDDNHDRALVVISADRTVAWELWHCTHAATAAAEPYYTAAVAVRWNLDPSNLSPANSGFQDQGLEGAGTSSARASGMPLVVTAITPWEALYGINHPIGLTVNSVSNEFVSPPASHSDGCTGCSHLRYGMLFVLRPDFQLPADASLFELNIVTALKRYGAFIADRGPLFELDGSPNEPTNPAASDELWQEAQDGDLSRLAIGPQNLLYVPTPGSPPPTP
jgi:hypothetical protein